MINEETLLLIALLWPERKLWPIVTQNWVFALNFARSKNLKNWPTLEPYKTTAPYWNDMIFWSTSTGDVIYRTNILIENSADIHRRSQKIGVFCTTRYFLLQPDWIRAVTREHMQVIACWGVHTIHYTSLHIMNTSLLRYILPITGNTSIRQARLEHRDYLCGLELYARGGNENRQQSFAMNTFLWFFQLLFCSPSFHFFAIREICL